MSSRLHVAVLAATGRMGGAERSLLALMSAASRDLRFTVVLPEAGELEREARAAGAAIEMTPWSEALLKLGERAGRPKLQALSAATPALWRAVADTRATITGLRPDVVVTNGIKPHLIGALARGGSTRWPLVWYLRDSLDGRTLSHLLLSCISKRCAGAIAISNYIARDARRYIDEHVPVRVIPNILEPSTHSRSCSDDVPIKEPGSIWFATIGALTPLKGQDVFLRAAAQVAAQIPESRFLIIGISAYRTEERLDYASQLRRLASDLNVGDRVWFLGQRDDVPALLGKIDVVVQANRGPEGFGRSVAEAMGAGVPVIASDGWGLAELIEHGRTGWLASPGDVGALAGRMASVARDPDDRRRVSELALEHARRSFSPARSAGEFVDFVSSILE